MQRTTHQFTKAFILLLFFAGFSLSAISQSDAKMQKTLEKQFQLQQFEKCKKSALKFKIKQPNSSVPYYYLSRMEFHQYNSYASTPDKKQFRPLKKAASYASKIADDYPEWEYEIRRTYLEYILSWKDPEYTSTHVKSAVSSYTKIFKDTLDLYYKYNTPKEIKAEKIVANNDLPKADSLRTEILRFASKWVGTPYKYAGQNPETGFDCSGFVKYVYNHVGIPLPHSSQMQSEIDGELISMEKAKPGDLIFFGKKSGNTWKTQHAGIFYSNENGEPKVIHCASRGVCIDGNNSSWDSYWKDLILFVKRVPTLN